MSNIQQLKCLVQITQGLIHIYFESKDCILILQLFKLRHRNIKPLAQDTPLAEGRADSCTLAERLQSPWSNHWKMCRMSCVYTAELKTPRSPGLWLSYASGHLQGLWGVWPGLEGPKSSRNHMQCICVISLERSMKNEGRSLRTYYKSSCVWDALSYSVTIRCSNTGPTLGPRSTRGIVGKVFMY